MNLFVLVVFGVGFVVYQMVLKYGSPFDRYYQKSVIDELKDDALRGDIEAQVCLGYAFLLGDEVEQDYEQALKWFLKAAQFGDAYAQFGIASMYSAGLGVKEDFNVAIEWFEKSANKGCTEAYFFLGSMYVNGQGAAQNYQKAGEYFEQVKDKENYEQAWEIFHKSAKGFSDGQFTLGFMYQTGQGVNRDFKKAKKWYKKSAKHGCEYAREALEGLKDIKEAV
jgi:TPR repeat protein